MKGNTFLISLLILTLLGCVEPFEPETGDFESVLVVEGNISDAHEPYLITVSRTAPLGATGAVPVSNAAVRVKDEEGAAFDFAEIAAGKYQSNPLDFIGCAGKNYSLSIVTASNQKYESEMVTLKPSPPIDSVYFERDIRLTDAGDTLDGVRIMVDTHDPQARSRYYRYSWLETYEVRPYYPSYYEWDFAVNPPEFVRRNPEINLCFKTDTSGQVLVTSTANLTEDRVSQFEVNYVSTESFRLKSLYSILVRQQTLSEDGFRYWNEVRKTTESLGTLFDPQPYQLVGNIKNIDNPDEPVLGYFDASAVSQKRIYISRDEVRHLTYPFESCILETKSFTPREEGDVFKDEFNLFIQWGYMIVDAEGLLWAPPECADCRLYGTLTKPDFWPR
ncbi:MULTISPECIES: DUF4249 domain-containing protein [unclassified Imperialibacter]|uniref:DUF4249 domain-containing protein n=1 Tax=unclassified Imperialibacter TaxID=2629706 RepID=UPI0012520E48|nr:MULTISPECIES: DUF4249 domain-containing protein [unclassified Imperialibacter]CAD5290709.1 conserved hypothetical protein [Imperialibacter sp. 89]CAD5290973.1 conserved hypothetical protein [Imperialibacter sp. 75]VVT34435.1 conserved hypothetical protein [Imperialibacter sp. EC-SDR9]